jgi:hypothetical protein
MSRVYPITRGLYCVPSAIEAITGAEPYSVILPAIHRHKNDPFLFGEVAGVQLSTMYNVLNELGYTVRRAKESGRHQLRWWARMSQERRWPHPVLVSNGTHAMVVFRGRVYDTAQPHGAAGEDHPEARCIITNVAIVVKREE